MEMWMNTYTGEVIETLWGAIKITFENLRYYHFWAPKWVKIEG
jgi:hypothetical protein